LVTFTDTVKVPFPVAGVVHTTCDEPGASTWFDKAPAADTQWKLRALACGSVAATVSVTLPPDEITKADWPASVITGTPTAAGWPTSRVV
jgi:hypothetical protein